MSDKTTYQLIVTNFDEMVLKLHSGQWNYKLKTELEVSRADFLGMNSLEKHSKIIYLLDFPQIDIKVNSNEF